MVVGLLLRRYDKRSPDERGELIPGGLAGKDGYCFDLSENDQESALYLLDRLKEAAKSAADGSCT